MTDWYRRTRRTSSSNTMAPVKGNVLAKVKVGNVMWELSQALLAIFIFIPDHLFVQEDNNFDFRML